MPANLFDLTGRVALVTGGNKGLGKAMARGFAEAGADVVIASRHEDELKSAPRPHPRRDRPSRGVLRDRRFGPRRCEEARPVRVR